MADGFQDDIKYEDISSSSAQKGDSFRNAARNYGNGAVRHLDKVVKAISFIVAICVLLAFAAAAFLLFKMDRIFSMVALCVLIVGILLALVFLFLIYAIGHIIAQNNEILKRL